MTSGQAFPFSISVKRRVVSSDYEPARLGKNIRMRLLDNGNFEMTLASVEFTRLTPAELKEHRERAGLKILPAIDDE
jgi:hypothetical protein